MGETPSIQETTPDRFVPVRWVREQCGGVSRITIWRWVRHGELPAPVRVGGRVLWSEAELNEWIAARKAARRG